MLISRESYLVVSDLHFNTHKQNRFNYHQECVEIIEQLHIINRGIVADKKFLISLGDIVDRGKKDSILYDQILQLLKMLISDFDDVFQVLGNHEKTYYHDNPLFSFIASFDTQALSGWKAKPKSSTPCIKVVDRLEFADVEFVFRHYGTAVHRISDKTGILFTHENIFPEAAKHVVPYLKQSYSGKLDGYAFVFNAHLHSIRATWSIGDTQIHNLGSLLRTSSDDIDDVDLNRIVPVVYINNNRLETIQFAKITLPERNLVYQDESYADQKEVRELAKERKEYKELGRIFYDNDEPLKFVDEAVDSTRDFQIRCLWNKIKGGL